MMRLLRISVCLNMVITVSLLAEDGASVEWARENILAGKYGDAAAMLRKLLPEQPAQSAERRSAAMLLVEVLRITGELQEARGLCDGLLNQNPKDPDVALLAAEVDVETGKYRQAKDAYDRIIADQKDNHRAWALRSIVLRLLSDRDGLKATADHFFDLYQNNVEHFNDKDIKDPCELAYIGLGFQDENPKDAFEIGFMLAEQRLQERGLIAPEVLLWSAQLAQKKYHFAFAAERYQLLLKQRPKLPDALAGMASILMQTQHQVEQSEKLLQDALTINPNHVKSLLTYARIDLEEDRYDEAFKKITLALKTNPNDLGALALEAFYYLDNAALKKVAEVEQVARGINAHCADFYCDIGEELENKRGFNTAAEWYQKAIDADPEYWRGYYGLGMNLSRRGAPGEEQGKELLVKAFAKNQFNVWAANMLAALRMIIGDKEREVEPVYSVSQTPHFVLKFHNKDAEIIRPYLEQWAEDAYAWQTHKFGFEPEGPLTIEVCYSFQDQAARTVGLPDLGALGVCFGKLCTVVSPREGGNAHPLFNWRKVMEHEFGHVMTLQLSKFRVPRWYTEGFSTFLEGESSRIENDGMMVDALAKGRLKPLGSINEYFRTNPLLAYIHGKYIIQYLDRAFGFECHIKALRLFGEGKKLAEVLPAATGKTMDELQAGQLEYLKQELAHIRLHPSYDPASMVQLELAAQAPDASAQARADLAMARLAQRKSSAAAELANQALEKEPKCVDALNVLGAIAFAKKDYEAAKQQYEKSVGLDPRHGFNAWHSLGVIYKKEGRTTKAIEAFETARKIYPRYIGPDNPHHELPDLYLDLEPEQTDKALAVWRDAITVCVDDAEAAMNGLKLAIKIKDYKAAVEFALAHIAVDPYQLDVHRLAGRAYEALQDPAHAAREYHVGTVIDEKNIECWLGLARANQALGQMEEARKAVAQARAIDAADEDARKMQQELGN